MQNSIIANNTSLDGNNSDAIRRYYVSIKNSIIGENSDFGLSEARTPDANGNLIGTPENPFDPQLGELTVGANGIPFLPLLPTSPAINLGNSFYATDNNLLFDVRGEQRIIGASVDAGAVEFNGFDFGDAADSYQTLLGSNGPRHLAIGPQLGAGRTIEEDASFSEDEFDDGVQFSELVPGTPASVSVTISNAPQGARLSGWIDFNGNGQFDGSAEAVFQRVLLSGDGTYEMPYQVPFDAQIQETQARFRLSSAGETDWFGQADDGEVEDYLVSIIEPPFVSLSTSAATGQEENQSRISLIATSARPVNGEQQVTVRFSGNAVYGSDYTSDSFVITIPAGEISGSIEIQILEDLRPEPIETIIASVISTTAGLQYDQSATTQVQIEDNDQVSPNGSFSTLTGFSEGKVWISLPDDSGTYASPTFASNLPFSDIQLVKYGDFNGDGFQDIALWRENGEWWVGEASGRGLFFLERWGAWRSGDIGGIRVGDFNGDGKDDLIGLFKVEGATHGNWWAAVSTGTSFENRLWGQYGSFSGIREIVVGNFDGLKGDDLAIVAVSGVVWIAKTSNSSFQYLKSHQWDVQNGINFIQTGDFNGDNRDDLLAVLGNGERRTVSVAKSYGPTKGLISSVWSEWTVRGSLDGVFVGDFDGDGRDNVVGQFNRSKLWFGESDGRAFRMQYWLNWNEISSGWASISVGNSNGDQRVDLIAQTLDGTWRAAESSGSSFAERELVKWDSPRSFLSTNVGYHSQHTSTGEFDVSMVNWDSFSGRWVAPVQSPVQQTAAATPEDLVTVNIPSAAEYEAFAEDQLLESLLGG
ncbi:MAG: VCBS repeat-containing protein [Planctomycetaceae bacterium]|nr:VCBS repeat-containing protein [Planctomycetaceae bacterium]